MFNSPRTVAVLLPLTVLMLVCCGHAAAFSGDEILAQVDQFRNLWDSYVVNLVLENRMDSVPTKTFEFEVYIQGKDDSLAKFLAPPSEKGKLLLTTKDGMYFYVPSTSRPIRISPIQRLLGPVSNSDVARTYFSEDYNVAATRTATEGADSFIVLDLSAKNKNVGYSRIELWVTSGLLRPYKALYYVVSGKLVKTCYYEGFVKTDHGWTYSVIRVENALNRRETTTMTIRKAYPKQFPAYYFSREYLPKIR
ncbi:MAG: outer membrane lipoprotein-sorting protein [Acidobacteria bacterium]|nr:outer membrane lipoprotein-sorting protein [Acidobacteriota bacterium]